QLDWLMRNLESVRLGSPRYLIYLKALWGIGFVGGPGSYVVVDQRDNLPMLLVNESYTDAVTQQRLYDLVNAAFVAVARAPAPSAPPAEGYRARPSRVPAPEEGRGALAMIKQAIDMPSQLPPELAKLASALADLRYEPRTQYDKRSGAVALGSMAHDAATGRP